ncbi:Shedu anti-phage system protein SduA domain-containing protein [Pseudomonas citronellolis]|uniref:Shedu anti-phage system protein SduA domain-containing protein n=2 Tax=Pseudomonas citronellolis TaxID=53408 RepID=UPI00209D6DB9|nr:Shedu anti-phage system protein SduA domain-containing protein [Pseudomonas citronellolis]MCP1667505.1 hypothetical protein [Pseudomonas citronellolis]MCP1800073.1 hypothetical protein [Pseudomonas citronellolis]
MRNVVASIMKHQERSAQRNPHPIEKEKIMPTAGRLIEADLQLLKHQPITENNVKTLPDLLETSGFGESAVHESLCVHPEYFTMFVQWHHGNWFDWIITKYELPNGNITDFLYITTTSTKNTIVLVEIEDPEKKIWVGKPDIPQKSNPFVRAIEQVTNWRNSLQDTNNKSKLISDMKAMMGGCALKENIWEVEYVLIYGRSRENISQAQKDAFSQLSNDTGIHIRTFDNLVTGHKNGHSRSHNIVKITRPGPKFSYTHLHKEPKNEFAYLLPGTMIINDEVETVLKSKDYDIDAWKNGELLTINHKYPSSREAEIFDTLTTSHQMKKNP